MLWPGVPVRRKVRLSSVVRLPEEVSDVVPAALEERREELVAYARRRVGARAEDVVQDAAERALRYANGLNEPAAARAWLFTIVRRLVAEQRERPEDELSTQLAREDDAPGDACGCVLEQVRHLPPEQAQLLSRVVIEEESVPSLAKERGMAENSAWVRLHRARQALKARLKRHCGTESLRACLDCGCVERGCCR